MSAAKWNVVLAIGAMLALAGCSKEAVTPVSDTPAMQGTWKGDPTAAGAGGAVESLVISGDKMDYHGADTNEWYQGTFVIKQDLSPKRVTVSITACPFPDYVGKTSFGIYKLEGNSLTIAANEPGTPGPPLDFDTNGNARLLTLKKQ